MSRAITRSRYAPDVEHRDSRTANQARPRTTSPYRSSSVGTRRDAAELQIKQREIELIKLRKLALKESDPKKQHKLAQRILATANNIKSWYDYLGQDCPREIRAAMIPA